MAWTKEQKEAFAKAAIKSAKKAGILVCKKSKKRKNRKSSNQLIL